PLFPYTTLFRCSPNPTTTISSSDVELMVRVIAMEVLPPTGTSSVLYPMNDTTSTSSGFASREKRPSASTIVPVDVDLINTLAPINGDPSAASVTVPWIVDRCAMAPATTHISNTQPLSIRFPHATIFL